MSTVSDECVEKTIWTGFNVIASRTYQRRLTKYIEAVRSSLMSGPSFTESIAPVTCRGVDYSIGAFKFDPHLEGRSSLEVSNPPPRSAIQNGAVAIIAANYRNYANAPTVIVPFAVAVEREHRGN